MEAEEGRRKESQMDVRGGSGWLRMGLDAKWMGWGRWRSGEVRGRVGNDGMRENGRRGVRKGGIVERGVSLRKGREGKGGEGMERK